MIDNGGSKYLSPGKVAKYFGVDPHTVAVWCDKGWLAHIRTKVGNRFVRQVLKSSVDEFETKHFRPATAEPQRRRGAGRPRIYRDPQGVNT